MDHLKLLCERYQADRRRPAHNKQGFVGLEEPTMKQMLYGTCPVILRGNLVEGNLVYGVCVVGVWEKHEPCRKWHDGSA